MTWHFSRDYFVSSPSSFLFCFFFFLLLTSLFLYLKFIGLYEWNRKEEEEEVMIRHQRDVLPFRWIRFESICNFSIHRERTMLLNRLRREWWRRSRRRTRVLTGRSVARHRSCPLHLFPFVGVVVVVVGVVADVVVIIVVIALDSRICRPLDSVMFREWCGSGVLFVALGPTSGCGSSRPSQWSIAQLPLLQPWFPWFFLICVVVIFVFVFVRLFVPYNNTSPPFSNYKFFMNISAK